MNFLTGTRELRQAEGLSGCIMWAERIITSAPSTSAALGGAEDA